MKASGSTEREPDRENPVVEVIPLKGWRKVLAERMLSSHLTHAEVTQMREVDATGMVDLRQSLLSQLEAKYGFRLSYTHLLHLDQNAYRSIFFHEHLS